MAYRLNDDENRTQDIIDKIDQLDIQTFSPEVVARNQSTRNTGIESGDSAALNPYPQWIPIRDFGTVGNLTLVIDLNRVDTHIAKMTLNGDTDFAFSFGPGTNKMIEFILDATIDATGGYTINLLNNILPAGITIDNTANARTVIRFTSTDGGTTYYAEDLTTAGGGGGGLNTNLSNMTSPTIPPVNLSMNGKSITNALSLDIEDSAGATKLTLSGPLGVGARLAFVTGDSVIFTENITDRLTISGTSVKIGTDLDYNTFDGINVDRLRFVFSSGAPSSSGDPSIFLDSASNMVFNIADQKQYFWNMDNKTRMQLDQDGVNNDTVLLMQTDTGDASALPFLNIFRNDPTPQSGAGGDSEITNLQFIGTNAATNGGASAGNTIYSKIVTTYESVITNRQASSVNFFTSFDTGAATQLKSFLGLNNGNSEEIEAFVDLDMQSNRILAVSEIQGDNSPTFQIGFDTSGDSDTFMSSRSAFPDRVDMTVNGTNAWLWAFDTTLSEVAVGLISGTAAHLLLTDHAVYINPMTIIPDANLGNSQGAIFFDNSTNPAILKIKKKDSGGTASVVSLEGAGSQTPWLSNIDAAGFDLDDMGIITFGTSGIGAGSTAYIVDDGANLRLNVNTGDAFLFTILNSTELEILSNIVRPGSNGTVSLGGTSNHWDDVFSETFTLRGSGGNTTASARTIYADANNMLFNMPTGDGFEWSVNNNKIMDLRNDGFFQLFDGSSNETFQLVDGRIITSKQNSFPIETQMKLNNSSWVNGNRTHLINFTTEDSSSNIRRFASIDIVVDDDTTSSLNASMNFKVAANSTGFDGSLVTALELSGVGGVAGIGFLGATPIGRPTVTGSRGGNVALASLLTDLASLGLIVDGTVV